MTTQSILTPTLQAHLPQNCAANIRTLSNFPSCTILGDERILQAVISAQRGPLTPRQIVETASARTPAKPTAMILLLMVNQEQFTNILQDIVPQARGKIESATCDDSSTHSALTRTEQMDAPSMLNHQRWIAALSKRESEIRATQSRRRDRPYGSLAMTSCRRPLSARASGQVR